MDDKSNKRTNEQDNDEKHTIKKVKVDNEINHEVPTKEMEKSTIESNDGNSPEIQTETVVKKMETQDKDEIITKPVVTTGFTGFSNGGFSKFNGFAAFQNTGTASFASFSTTNSNTSGFGETISKVSDFEQTNKEEISSNSTFSEVPVENGEEGEKIVLEKRAKIFKLAKDNYVEVGIGPMRILKRENGDKTDARIVMRRESYANGPGTKVLLNAYVHSCISLEKKTEKSFSMTLVQPEGDMSTKEIEKEEKEAKMISVMYLVRFSTTDACDDIMKCIQSNRGITST